MKRTGALYRNALFLYLTDPLFYISSIILILFCSFRFFFIGHFFIAGSGSTDMRPLFSSIPALSILLIPLLVLRIRSLITDESIPILPFARTSVVTAASSSAFFAPVALLLFVPLFVSRFGTVSAGQVFAGFTGIFFYTIASCSLAVFLFTAFSSSPVVPFLITAASLAIVNTIHLLPLYTSISNSASSFIQTFSFAWHFDAAGKGIIDASDILFYCFASLLFVTLSAFVSAQKTERKVPLSTFLLSCLLFVLFLLCVKTVSLRKDLTSARQFSVSSLSKNVLSNISEPLTVTYYRSEELRSLYPQTNDVSEFLADYCAQNKKMRLHLEKADADKMSKLGIQGQQIRTSSDTKTELTTVYSAVIIDYLGKSDQIPFVLSTETLEYDLTRRIQKIVFGINRSAIMMTGNGLSLDTDYQYAAPWLESRGFSVTTTTPDNFSAVKSSLPADTELIIFGSSSLTESQSSLIADSISEGMKSFIATTPYSVDITGDWTVSRVPHDTLIPILSSWGISFNKSLAADISCFPMVLESGEGNSSEQTTVNYPLWISLLPQPAAPQGMTSFWPSPLALYGKAEPVLVTTNSAWETEESTESTPFITNPFLMPKTAKAAEAVPSVKIIAARVSAGKGEVTVLSDSYSVSSMMTSFTSTDSQGDFRNYDFLASELLRLRGEGELSLLMNKARPQTQLYKITDETQFAHERSFTLVFMFILIPVLLIMIFIAVCLIRLRYNKRGCAK